MDHVASEMNYIVRNRELQESEILALVKANLGKKILYIVSGKVTAVRNQLVKKLGRTGVDVVVLDIEHIDNLKETREMVEGVVIATNICECAANMNPDIAVDSQPVYTPVWEGDEDIIVAERPISFARKVQRRGRAGRRKPGDYYVIGAPTLASTRFFPQGTAMWDDIDVFLSDEPEAWEAEVCVDEENALLENRCSALQHMALKSGVMHDLLASEHNVAPSTFVRLRNKAVEGSVAGYQELGSRSNRQYKLCNECLPQMEFVDCCTHKHSAVWVVEIPLGYLAVAVMCLLLGLLGWGWMTLKILGEDNLFDRTCRAITRTLRIGSMVGLYWMVFYYPDRVYQWSFFGLVTVLFMFYDNVVKIRAVTASKKHSWWDSLIAGWLAVMLAFSMRDHRTMLGVYDKALDLLQAATASRCWRQI